MFKTCKSKADRLFVDLPFGFSLFGRFEFVSDFGFRISNLACWSVASLLRTGVLSYYAC
jgi:hypothetical protein